MCEMMYTIPVPYIGSERPMHGPTIPNFAIWLFIIGQQKDSDVQVGVRGEGLEYVSITHRDNPHQLETPA